MFSPYYRRQWQRGRAVAENHCAINVALYSPGQERWTMTERGQRSVRRTADRFDVGPSHMQWRAGELVVQLDERAVPLPRRVRGTVRVRPASLSAYAVALDDGGRHRWGPIAPCARVQVEMESPALSWQGHGYLDSNEGDEPVSEPFTTWDWMRAPLADGSCAVVYDVRQRGGRADRRIGQRFWPDGRSEAFAVPPRHTLAPTGWRVARHVCGEPVAGAAPRLLRSLEDSPFYARALVRTRLCGEAVDAVHETLSASRFASPVVQWMLPFRMPRRA